MVGSDGLWNLSSLKAYYDIALMADIGSGDEKKILKVPFIQCNTDHFVGVNKTSITQIIKTGFCPDLEKLNDTWKIKGSYNEVKRKSFSVSINECNKT